MKVQEIMTRNVITVAPTATVEEIAALLIERRVSAVPVVDDDGHVLGIISESDLCHRAEISTERKRKWWLEFFTGADDLARDYAKSHALKADDVMSRMVVSIPADADLAEVADILDTHRIRRVPVMQDRKLAGIISRSDIVRALAKVKVGAPAERSDSGAVQKAILEEMREQPWLTTNSVTVTVKDGVVELYGIVDSEEQRHALQVLVENVGGVRKVENNVRLYPPIVAA